MHHKKALLLVTFSLLSGSVMALGLPSRLYPAKVVKKTIQVIVKKVGR